jgi:hypothetical protein
MTARELDIRWDLAGVGEPTRGSSLQVTAPTRATGPEFLARLIVKGFPGEDVVGIPENAFVSMSQVATRVLPFGVQYLAGGFIVPSGTVDGLHTLFTELECEGLWMTFGGVESIEKLKEAVRPRGWWRFTASRSASGQASGLKCVLSYSASHNSLEVFGERGVVMALFDHLRAELRLSVNPKG